MKMGTASSQVSWGNLLIHFLLRVKWGFISLSSLYGTYWLAWWWWWLWPVKNVVHMATAVFREKYVCHRASAWFWKPKNSSGDTSLVWMWANWMQIGLDWQTGQRKSIMMKIQLGLGLFKYYLIPLYQWFVDFQDLQIACVNTLLSNSRVIVWRTASITGLIFGITSIQFRPSIWDTSDIYMIKNTQDWSTLSVGYEKMNDGR